MAYRRTTWLESETPLSAEHMNNIEDGIEEAMSKAKGNEDMWNYIRNMVYPVGSIYMSVNNVNPSTLFGGTWVAWGSGKVPVGVKGSDADFNTVEKSGGGKTHLHATKDCKLTAAQSGLPAHSHTFTKPSVTVPAHGHGFTQPSVSGGSHSHSYKVRYNSGSGSAYVSDVTSTAVKYTNQAVDGAGTHSHSVSGGKVADKAAFAASVSGGSVNKTAAAAASQAHNHGNTENASNLQPYITCYMWKRTA